MKTNIVAQPVALYLRSKPIYWTELAVVKMGDRWENQEENATTTAEVIGKDNEGITIFIKDTEQFNKKEVVRESKWKCKLM